MPRLTLESDSDDGLLRLLGSLVSSTAGPDVAGLRSLIMANHAQVLADLGAVKSALDKIGGETRGLLGTIDQLNERLANAANADPAVVALAAELRESVQRLDDMVPDVQAPEPEPTPEPVPAEPVVNPAEPVTDDGSAVDSAVR